MQRRSFISLLAATPIGVWIGAQLPIASRTIEVSVGSESDIVTLPVAKVDQTEITITAKHQDVVVIAGSKEWIIPAHQVRTFVGGIKGWRFA